MRPPTKVGITGGIGSGKSTVARIFLELGAPVYNADRQARFLTENDPDIRNGIMREFGEESFTDSGFNRDYISEIVFKDSSQLAKLNAIVHPKVAEDFSGWVSKQDHPYLLKEAALLFESGSYKQLDQTILVLSPLSIRKSRVLSRDSFRSGNEFDEIVKKQWSDEEKMKLANHQIRNGETDLLIPQVLQLHRIFSS